MVRVRQRVLPVVFTLILIGVYSCGKHDSSAPGPQPQTTAPDTAVHLTSPDPTSFLPFQHTPAEYDTTVQLSGEEYKLHVIYRSLNDNAVRQRVWYSTTRGADTPGVFMTSDREIEILCHKGSQLLFDKKIRKEQLMDSEDRPLSNLVLSQPDFVLTEGNEFVFGAGVGEADSDTGSWIEFALTPTGVLRIRSESDLEE